MSEKKVPFQWTEKVDREGKEQLKLGILTGGGDCAGLNAFIYTIVMEYQGEVYGIKDGWQGFLTKRIYPLKFSDVENIFHSGGTCLGTSRTKPSLEKIKRTLIEKGIDGLIVIGGNDTLSLLQGLVKLGIKVIGIPKTIDNDVESTDLCLGFQTAVEIGTKAVKDIKTSAKSHNRIIVVEVMGRSHGTLANQIGIGSNTPLVLIPEEPKNLNWILSQVQKMDSGVVIIAEGFKLDGKEIRESKERDAYGNVMLGGVAKVLVNYLKTKTKKEMRSTEITYQLRGAEPIAQDRILAVNFARHTLKLIEKNTWNRKVVMKNGKVRDISVNGKI